MSPKRARCPGASTAAAFLLALASAAPAGAAEYTVRPSVLLEQSFDDNVLSVDHFAGDHATGLPSREISSWNTRIAPLFALDRKTDTNTTTLEAGFSRRKTYSQSQLDGTDEHLLASTRQILSPRFTLGVRGTYDLYASYSAIEEPLVGGQPLVLYGERPEVMRRLLETDLVYRINDTTELTTRLGYEGEEYGRTGLPPVPIFPPLSGGAYLDSTDRSVSLTLAHRLSQMDSVGLLGSLVFTEEISSDTSIFHSETQTENELRTLLAFWQRAWSPRWSTTLQAGARRLETEGSVARFSLTPQPPAACPGFPQDGFWNGFCPVDISDSDSGRGFVGGGSTEYAYSPRGTISLSITRDTRTGVSSATGSTAIDIDSFGATLTHRLAPRLTLSATGSYSSYESTFSGGRQGDATTRLHGLDLRLTWQMRRNLGTYAGFYYYDYDQNRTGGVSDRDYVRRIFSVGMRYAFDREL